MGHCLTAIIGDAATVARVAEAAESPPPRALAPDLAISALGEDQIDRLTALQPGTYRDGFRYLSQGLVTALSAAAGGQPLGYVETDYFGGKGSQGACLIAEGAVLTCAVSTARPGPDSPINALLRHLGVVARRGQDEFDTLGLARFRSNEDLAAG